MLKLLKHFVFFSAVFCIFLSCKSNAKKIEEQTEKQQQEGNENTSKTSENLLDDVKFNMVDIPALTTPTTLCFQKGVSLSAFQLSQTEVTQELYTKVMQENPTLTPPASGNIASKCPVSQVNWYEAVAFCNELTIKTEGKEDNCTYYSDEKKTKVYKKEDAKGKKYPYVAWNKTGYRLPTEAEWERAALANKTYKYPGSNVENEIAHFDTNATTSVLHNVASKKANDFSLYDMAGNVAEWVWDPYVNNDVRKAHPIKQNPTYKHKRNAQNSCEGYATIRGGDYACNGTFVTTPLMCKTREECGISYAPDAEQKIDIGIRLAKSAIYVVYEKVGVEKITIGTYEMLQENIEKAESSEGFQKEFSSTTQDVKIVVEAEEGASISFSEGSSTIHLTKELQKIVFSVEKTQKGKRVFTLFLKKNAGIPSSINNGDKIKYTVSGTQVSFNMVSIAQIKDATIGRENHNNNKPHKVSLSSYQIGETEVTQKLYEAVVGRNPSFFTNEYRVPEDVQENRPVDSVHWHEAVAFCNMLTQKVSNSDAECVYYEDDAFTQIYTMENAKRDISSLNKTGRIPKTPYVAWQKKGFRLPTEAEWEWASYGGEEGKYSGSNDLLAVAWCGRNSTYINKYAVSREVAKKQANGFGLYDMTGNLYEWCGQWWKNETPEGGDDPKGENILPNRYKVQRSSSYGLSEILEKEGRYDTSRRDYNSIFYAHKTCGIRLCSHLF